MTEHGLSEEQAMMVILQDEYDRLPIDQKIKRLEAAITNMANQFQNLAVQIGKDVDTLQHNDAVIADALDINFKGVARALELAGVTSELQKELMEKVTAEMSEERARRAEIMKKEREVSEAKSAEQALQAAETNIVTPAPEVTGAPAPEGATTFGD